MISPARRMFETESVKPNKMRMALVIITIITAVRFPIVCVGQGQIDRKALEQLIVEAQKAHSDALVIWKDGKPYGEWYFGKKPTKIEAMSITKAIVNLAIGRLITEGKIKSVDQPVYEFYAEWRQGRKKNITIRHLLNHTSGLQNVPRADEEIYPSPDFVQLALAAELQDDPGTVFSYNNKAVNLLAGIVHKASGKRMDLYIADEIFAPLGIKDFSWTLDKAGNPHAMAGLQILPADLAKIGQLVLNKGRWGNRQIISESWSDLSLSPGQPFEPSSGLLWWLMYDKITYVVDEDQINMLIARGVSADFIQKARSLIGRYASREDYEAALERVFGKRWREEINSVLAPLSLRLSRKEVGSIIGYYAEGYLGQYLIILPRHNLVVVRMISWYDGYDFERDGFTQIFDLVRKLTN